MVLDGATGLDARIANMRNHVATAFGMLLPEIRLTDNLALPRGTYVVRVQGVEQARDVLRPGQLLALASGTAALPGEEVREPVYGAPASWIAPEDREQAALLGLTVVTAPEVLATHLLEVIKRNLSRLLSLRVLRRILDEMLNLSDSRRVEMNRRMLEELVPERVPLDLLLGVLRLLLDERVSIRNMPLILEAVSEARTIHSTAEGVADHVRQRLGFQLVAELRRADGSIPLIQLAPDWEKTFAAYQLGSDRSGSEIALPPEEFNRLANGLAERIARAAEAGAHPAVVTSSRRRRFLRTVLVAKGISNPVLSFEEIGVDARPALLGVVAA
jgi:flagellar biosynthesis protein FlhA